LEDLDSLSVEMHEQEDIEDEVEDVVATSELFSISSFGVDYPVETLVNRTRKEMFYLPDFQRQFIWSQNQASRFIESLLLGLPVPGIFLFKESNTGKHLVIDGQQRLKSLQYFFDGKFNNKVFKLRGLDSLWEGKSFQSLSDEDQFRLSDAVIHTTVFKQDLPKEDINSVYEVFERINTGGIKLSPQEIRSCVCHGNFNDFLHSLNNDENWRVIYGPKSKRLKDVEIILRFLAFYEKKRDYSSPMKHFLNDYMGFRRNSTDAELEHLRNVFSSTMEFVLSSLSQKAFRPDRSLNVAVFDSVATSIARMLQGDNPLDLAEAKAAYDYLLSNDEFKSGYLQATADNDNVAKRFKEANSAFRVT